LGTALIPVVTKLVNAVVPLVTQISAWIQSHQQLIASLAPVIVIGLAAIGMLLIMVGTIMVVGPAIAALTTGSVALIVIGLYALIVVAILVATHWRLVTAEVRVAWQWFLTFLSAARAVADHIPVLGGVLEILIAIVTDLIAGVRTLVDHWGQI